MKAQTISLDAESRFAVIIWRSQLGNQFVTVLPCNEGDTMKSIQREWKQTGKCVLDVRFVERMKGEDGQGVTV